MAKVIMVQGTMSNAGKSLIAAALCRIFKEDGYHVAPFKSQNMALNSYITADGFEMGRAQVLQAQAAGIEPDVRMNPILLKPTTDKGSQVIVMGKPIGDMSAADYYKYKSKLKPEIMKAFNSLSEEYDIIVIEGAGSPAEINLNSDDIVNMGMAKMANSPVLLVADIDRGGVFAQLAGTVMLLNDEERERVRGMIINKFRGDIEILKPGLEMIEDITKKPVIGVVPYMHLNLEDEDSLSQRFESKKTGIIDIAVVRLERISNFTDFNIFEEFEGVNVRYVSRAAEMGEPDMVIIPGTKSTSADLLQIRENGLEAAVKKLVDKGVPLFAICGGYQMLGKEIRDVDSVEGKSVRGMGILDTVTEFTHQKRRRPVKGHFNRVEGVFSNLSHKEFTGYEIHMGVIENEGSLTSVGGTQKGNVYGTFVHGIFDGTAKYIVEALCKRKGIKPSALKNISADEIRERDLNKLADMVRESIDMGKIYDILAGH